MAIEAHERTDVGEAASLAAELRVLAARIERLGGRRPLSPSGPIALDPGSPAHFARTQDMLASPRLLAAKFREVVADRRRRRDFFPTALLGEPGWDMLLDLTVARFEHAQVTTTSLCEASAVPHTTALRWLHAMEEMGLIRRRQDPLDARRWLVTLTDDGWSRMWAYIGSSRLLGH